MVLFFFSRKSDGGETTDSEDDLLSVHSRSVMSLVEEFNRQVPEMPDENNKQNVPYLIRLNLHVHIYPMLFCHARLKEILTLKKYYALNLCPITKPSQLFSIN